MEFDEAVDGSDVATVEAACAATSVCAGLGISVSETGTSVATNRDGTMGATGGEMASVGMVDAAAGAAGAGTAAGTGASSFVAATCAESAKRSSSSGLSAPTMSSASKLRLRTSLSLKANGQVEKASSNPMT